MNLTTAITILNDGKLIGPRNGCPILYTRDEDNPDMKQAIKTSEFFDYLTKQHIFKDVSSYCSTSFYLSWFYIDNGQEKTDSEIVQLQDINPISDFPQFVWSCLRAPLKYIWEASFKDKEFPMLYDGNLEDDKNQIFDVYDAVKEEFGDKLSKDTFIQAVNSWLERREKWNLSTNNIEYLVSYLKELLNNK